MHGCACVSVCVCVCVCRHNCCFICNGKQMYCNSDPRTGSSVITVQQLTTHSSTRIPTNHMCVFACWPSSSFSFRLSHLIIKKECRLPTVQENTKETSKHENNLEKHEHSHCCSVQHTLLHVSVSKNSEEARWGKKIAGACIHKHTHKS